MTRAAPDATALPPDADARRSPAAPAATAGPDLPFEAEPADFHIQVQALAAGRRSDDR